MLIEQRSQPTYEELKQEKNNLAGLGAYGSQPTYEELKHIYTACAILNDLEFSAYL